MDRANQFRESNNTLGLFVRGVPAIFVRLDIIAKQPPEIDAYITFYNESRQDISKNSQFSSAALMRGFEFCQTHLHETRHFHDCLLSLPLLESFVLACKRTVAITQLSSYCSALNEGDLPITINGLRNNLPRRAHVLLDHLEAIKASYDARIGLLLAPRQILGRDYSMSHLLEASAIILELVNAVHLHGWEASKHYYRNYIAHLPQVYSQLIETVGEYSSTWEESLETSHLIVSASLYDDDPLGILTTLLTNLNSGIGQTQALAVEHRKNLYSSEGELARRLSSIRLVSGDGEQPAESEFVTALTDVLKLPQSLLSARKALIEIYAGEWGYVLGSYLEHTHRLPMPPTVFFPIEESDVATAIRYENMLDQNRQCHVIRGTRNDAGEWDLIVAGIENTFGLPSVVPLPAVDLLLFINYCQRRLFESSKRVTYFNAIDEMYEALFQKHFLNIGSKH